VNATARTSTATTLKNNPKAVTSTNVNKTTINNAVANPKNPRHWSNWQRSWANYGVAPYQRNWYQGTWGGFNGPGYYTPFGFGYGGLGYGGGGYGGYGGYGLGGFGLGRGLLGGLGYGYGGLGGLGYGLGGYGGGLGGGYLNPWMLNSLGYQWGYYGGFNNPYYASTGSMPYNYSQPVALAYQDNNTQPPAEVVSDFEAARKAFRAGDYDQALSLVDRVIKDNPSDTAAHELRGLTLFAMGRYDESAATLNSLLAVAPGWSWQTMIGLYPDVNTYEKQLRNLEAFTKNEPKNAAGRFLLGYHYLVAGHQDAARRQFAQAVDLQPKDRVSEQLLAGLQKDEGNQQTTPPPEPSAEEKDHFKEGSETHMVGHWIAHRDKNSPAVEMNLEDNGKFNWTAGEGDKASKVEGNYELNGQTLVLDGGKNESLVGHLSSDGADKFHFKLLGSPPDDPGLEFERADTSR
jgi:tetratricopeptide (TPR) repeat protein